VTSDILICDMKSRITTLQFLRCTLSLKSCVDKGQFEANIIAH